MRVQLKTDSNFIVSLKTLNTILNNIMNDPSNIKFHKLRISNEKLTKFLFNFEACCFLLEMIGFDRSQQMAEEGTLEDFYILNTQRFSIQDFDLVIQIVDSILKSNNISPLTKNMSSQGDQQN